MADSADDLLAGVRRARQDWIDGDCMQDELLEDVCDAFAGLDALLSSGGPLPAAWLPAAEHLVQDVPGPDDSGLRVCVTCGETIRRVSAEDGIDPEDRDYYAWVAAGRWRSHVRAHGGAQPPERTCPAPPRARRHLAWLAGTCRSRSSGRR